MVPSSTLRFDKQKAILLAKKLVSRNALVLDTETTGLGTQDEIVELSLKAINLDTKLSESNKNEQESH